MRFTTALLLLFTASSLGACGGIDDVDVTLPFVGNIMAKEKAKEKKMATRGTLVLPPAVKGLPDPVIKSKSTSGEGWVNDPDQQAVSNAEVAAIKDKKYRKDGDWSSDRNTGNGLEDFNKKVDWQKRQTGVLQPTLKQE